MRLGVEQLDQRHADGAALVVGEGKQNPRQWRRQRRRHCFKRSRNHGCKTVRQPDLDLGRHAVPHRGLDRLDGAARLLRIGQQPPYVVRDEHRQELVQADAEQPHPLAR